jgi:hypothetical protein
MGLDDRFILTGLVPPTRIPELVNAMDILVHPSRQNYKALRRFLLLRRVLKGMDIEPERVKLVWASAAEGARFASETTLFVEEIRRLGPLNWGKNSKQLSVTGDQSTDDLSLVTDHSSKEVPA